MQVQFKFNRLDWHIWSSSFYGASSYVTQAWYLVILPVVEGLEVVSCHSKDQLQNQFGLPMVDSPLAYGWGRQPKLEFAILLEDQES